MVKTTKEFIQRFKLDQENYEFNREEFLLELNEYFLEILSKAICQNGKLQHPLESVKSSVQSGKFTWDMFKTCIKQVEQKFWAISNKKVGRPFSKKLWGAFYAIYVVKVRAELFPDIEEKIKDKRLKFLEQQD